MFKLYFIKWNPELCNIYVYEILENNFKTDEGNRRYSFSDRIFVNNRLGEVGTKIHSGKSRNYKIFVDLKLLVYIEIKEIVYITYSFFDLLLKLSEQYQNILMPGYTHYQIAMPFFFWSLVCCIIMQVV